MILAIIGPTAVGKTKLSIELAKKYNAIIINCDATATSNEDANPSINITSCIIKNPSLAYCLLGKYTIAHIVCHIIECPMYWDAIISIL